MGIKGLGGGRSIAPRGVDHSSAADASLPHLVVESRGVDVLLRPGVDVGVEAGHVAVDARVRLVGCVAGVRTCGGGSGAGGVVVGGWRGVCGVDGAGARGDAVVAREGAVESRLLVVEVGAGGR